MNSDMKKVLEEAFAAPEPKRKKEFLKKTGQPPIGTFSFMKLQISYIRKRVWFVSVLVLVLAIASDDFVGKDGIWVMSAMMPFIALCMITESARSETYGMAELELASRFSLKSIMLARLGIIGIAHLAVFCILIPFARKSTLIPCVQLGIYLLVPYLLTSILGLIAVRRVHGKEAIYICVGISVMVSYLNILIKESIPQLYEGKQLIWWVAVLIYLVIKVCSEYKKMIYRMEELTWN